MTQRRNQLYSNDAVWARFYRDGMTLGQVAKEFQCSIYDLSPWLTAPMIRATSTEVCMTKNCPRGGMPVEIVIPAADGEEPRR